MASRRPGVRKRKNYILSVVIGLPHFLKGFKCLETLKITKKSGMGEENEEICSSSLTKLKTLRQFQGKKKNQENM